MATWSAHRSIPPDLRLWMIFPLMFPRAQLKLCSIKHSFTSKEGGGRHVQAKVGKGEDVRLPLMDPCCTIPPLALSKERRNSMGLRPKRGRSDRQMVDADAEVAELVARMVNDPMVEVDPVTLGLHLSSANKGVETSTNLSNSVAISTRLPPFSFNSRGLNALAYSAAGASFVMVVAAVVHSLRSHATNHSNLVFSGRADTFSFNSARKAYVQEVVEASQASLASESSVSDGTLNGISEVTADAGKKERTDANFISEDVPKDENVDIGVKPAVSHGFQSRAARNIIQPASFSYVRNGDLPSYTDRTVSTDYLMNETQVPNYIANHAHTFSTDQILGENLPVANTKMADHTSPRNSEEAQLVTEEQDCRTEIAPKSDGEGSALQPLPGDDLHAPRNSKKSDAPLPAFISLGSTHKFDPCEDNLDAADKRKLDARKALQAAAPALAIGAGALGVLSGINGGLEMVGMAAVASFISYELLWAQTREQLLQEMRRVTDHEKLMHFLKARKILQDR